MALSLVSDYRFIKVYLPVFGSLTRWTIHSRCFMSMLVFRNCYLTKLLSKPQGLRCSKSFSSYWVTKSCLFYSGVTRASAGLLPPLLYTWLSSDSTVNTVRGGRRPACARVDPEFTLSTHCVLILLLAEH